MAFADTFAACKPNSAKDSQTKAHHQELPIFARASFLLYTGGQTRMEFNNLLHSFIKNGMHHEK